MSWLVEIDGLRWALRQDRFKGEAGSGGKWVVSATCWANEFGEDVEEVVERERQVERQGVSE